MLVERGEVSIGSHGVVVTIPLGFVLKIVGTLALLMALALVGLWRCWCGRERAARVREEPAAEEVERRKAKTTRRSRHVTCEVGVQGPVHYTGVGKNSGGNYQHITQGFRSGDEVTRLVADRPHAE